MQDLYSRQALLQGCGFTSVEQFHDIAAAAVTFMTREPAFVTVATMKQTKFVILAAGILGIIATFALPYMSKGEMSVKFWDFSKMPESAMRGLLNGPKQVYIALAGYALLIVTGALAMKRCVRIHGIMAIVFSLLTLATEGVRKGLTGDGGMSTAIGGKMLFVAAILGLVGGALAVAKPEA